MTQILSILTSFDYLGALGAFVAVLAALAALLFAVGALFAFIPGDQPEKAINAVGEKIKAFAEYVAKFSKK